MKLLQPWIYWYPTSGKSSVEVGEERLDVLQARIDESGMDKAPYWWYLESRMYGSVPHSGFGLGFERLLMLVTGISNIRDVIPFPRTPNNLEF